MKLAIKGPMAVAPDVKTTYLCAGNDILSALESGYSHVKYNLAWLYREVVF